MLGRFLCAAVLLASPLVAWAQEAADVGEGARDAITVIRDCAEADEDSFGLEELESACPGLEKALAESGYLPLLAAEQREALTADQLFELLQMSERDRASAAVPAPNADAVDSILVGLRQKESEHVPTWRERLAKWWRELTEDRESTAAPLSRWLENLKVSRVVMTVLVYGSMALVIGLAVVVLIGELRAAGVLRRRQDRAVAGAEPVLPAPSHALDADLDAVSAAEQAPLLLNKLVAALVRSGRLPVERSLTHRELGLRAVFEDAGERTSFQRLAQLAERIVYGTGKISPEDYEPIIAAGRALHSRLRNAGP